MRIIIDAMGGDFAPAAPVEGAVRAAEKYGVQIVLAGREEDILQELERLGHKDVPQGIEIVNTREVIEISDDAATAFKRKKDSSMTVGLTMLRDGEADGFISAGSTGALLAGATLIVKRIRGLRRAALAPVIPTYEGRAVLIDSGANADCTSEYLLQFAYLGSFYAGRVLGKENPRVALLNIGAEAEKGDALRLETYARLVEAHERGDINFIGNIEAKEAVLGGCDVIVADGFSGNILLKTIEGTAKFMGGNLKKMFKTSLKTKLAYLLLKKEFAAFRSILDPNRVGGTPILGISKPVLKAHGSASAEAFCNAVYQAIAQVESDIAADIAANIDKMKVGRETE
ncbi:MAG: phosphate acyltransferase PlsX [Oscillospiraceae bacterium]|nr:phosphate acyltransferase PlsX [Oscillospiraceae bacterium]MBQ5739943.1 phosphate acyltransferase PlsX [Oscillospiraceae bacterium]